MPPHLSLFYHARVGVRGESRDIGEGWVQVGRVEQDKRGVGEGREIETGWVMPLAVYAALCFLCNLC